MRYNVSTRLNLYHKEMKESIVVALESLVAENEIALSSAVAG
jgi:hypothetical protein